MRDIKQFGLRMPKEIKEWVTEQANKERMSINSFLLRMIENGMRSKS